MAELSGPMEMNGGTLPHRGLVPLHSMAAEHSLDRGRVKLSQNTTDRLVGWCFPPLHAERIAQLGKPHLE